MLRLLTPALLLAASTAVAADTRPGDVVQAGLKAAFVDFDAAALPDHFAEDYIQHNPAVPTGLAPLQGFLPVLKDMGLRADVHRMIVDGDLVATHATYHNAQAFGADTMVAFDIFRVEDGKIAEHWDNLAPIAPPNPSGRTQVDGLAGIIDRDKTAANKALVKEFVETVLVEGDFGVIGKFIGATYLQHNPQVGDGLEALSAFFADLAEKGIAVKYDRVHMVLGEGNFVVVASEGTIGGTPTAFYDMWRVENGRVVEHWDVISEIPAEMAHDNGKF